MTVKLSISVPDDVAAYLRDQGNASAVVTTATRKSANLVKLQAENGSPCSTGLDLAIFLTSRRCGSA